MRNGKLPRQPMNESPDQDDYLVPSSPTIITRYAHKSSRLIHSIEKNIFVVIGIVTVLAAIAVIDTLEVMGIIDFIDESLDDPVIAMLSLASIAGLVPILRLSFQSKRTLEEWANMFESNSLQNSISMYLTSATKQEAVYAVAEAVEEVGDLLLKYMEKGDCPEFFDVRLGTRTFDVLVDEDTVRSDKGAELKAMLESYGAIAIKLVNGKVSEEEITSFSNLLSGYAAQKRRKDAVGLAVMIGGEVSPEAYIFAKTSKMRNKGILLIEKPPTTS